MQIEYIRRGFSMLAWMLLINSCFAAEAQVHIRQKNVSFQHAIDALRSQTGYDFVYNSSSVSVNKRVDLSVEEANPEEGIKKVIGSYGLLCRIEGRMVIVKPPVPQPKVSVQSENQQPDICISGYVLDSEKQPLPGATIKVIGSNRSVASDQKGTFSLGTVPSDARISFSSLGFEPMEIQADKMGRLPVDPGKSLKIGNAVINRVAVCDYRITLQVSSTMLEVAEVNTGMFTRRKDSFTGVTRTLSGDELRAVSRQNIIEGLNTLDPSFRIIRDNNLGSDPNQLPKIEFRGVRSIPSPGSTTGLDGGSQQLRLQYAQDPNQPLFILDGFEATLQDIINLDINRIESVVLLKDAASTALYGPRSANGVVVIDTKRPVAGKLRVSYTATGQLSVPDLSGYNMMDAGELLKFQMLTGENGPYRREPLFNSFVADAKYSFRNNYVLRGVNTDWMQVPLRTGFSLNHSISVMGGDEFFTYNVGLSKNGVKGVMDGSENGNIAGYTVLNYRHGRFNISNNFRVEGTTRKQSPYGNFRDYVKLPPYYPEFDENGNRNTARYLEYQDIPTLTTGNATVTIRPVRIPNPLYNASLPYKNQADGLTLTNNLNMYYDLYSWLRISAGGQFIKSTMNTDVFKSPLHTDFDEAKEAEKGSFDNWIDNQLTYRGNLMLTVNRVFAEKHIVNANLRADITREDGRSQSTSGVGFASTSKPLLFLANSYKPNQRPGGNDDLSRSLAFTASLNYSYDNRYNADLSYNRSGSNRFGADNPFISFFSAGLGWNIANESFLKSSKEVNTLRLSANFGLTGNELSGGYGSRTTYLLSNTPTHFGEAISVNGIGNPNLQWSKTYKTSVSVDGVFFNNRLSLSANGFYEVTDPMVIQQPLPPSLGIANIPTNIGILKTHGLDLLANFKVIASRNWDWQMGWNSPVVLASKYSGLGERLKGFSDQARDNEYLMRYIDGSSPFDVWAVRSEGIDPVTGYEVFLDKDGKYTYRFDSNNEVKVGSSRPITQGIVNSQLRYRRFSLSIFCRYVVGETKFNNALFKKVEGFSADDLEYNQDRRALYERWKQPGDNAPFLNIAATTQGMSSRFLQKENAVYFESVSLNYDFNALLEKTIGPKLGLSRLDFSINLNEFFRFQLSNIRLERGLDYPFARSISFNLNASF